MYEKNRTRIIEHQDDLYMGIFGSFKKNLQYVVTLTSGNDKGLKRYVWASGFQINNARKKIFITSPNYVGFNTTNLFIMNKFGSKAGYNELKDDSLSIIAKDEENANFIAQELNLPSPFEKIKKNNKEIYILNRFGENKIKK
jgi:hypothetical protein